MDNLWRSLILGPSGSVADSLHTCQTSKPKLKSINHPKFRIKLYLWLSLMSIQDPASGTGFRGETPPLMFPARHLTVGGGGGGRTLPLCMFSAFLKNHANYL